MEAWEIIGGYPGYFVSNLGRVKSFLRGEIILKPYLSYKYPAVHLVDSSSGKVKNHRIHRLVATAFIPNPENKPQVNHKDGNKLNNCVENLEWVTAKENTQHALKTGLCKEKKLREIKSVRNKTLKEYKSKPAKGNKTVNFYHNDYGVVTATKQSLCYLYGLNPVAISSLICGFRNNYDGWVIIKK